MNGGIWCIKLDFCKVTSAITLLLWVACDNLQEEVDPCILKQFTIDGQSLDHHTKYSLDLTIEEIRLFWL